MSIGKIGEFDVKTQNWTLYIERLEMYFKVNRIEEALWLPTLIAGIGDNAYELLSNLTCPDKPSGKTYKEAVQVMASHLQPKRSIMVERYHFRQRRQKSSESVADYITELKRLSRYCEFGKVLEDNLRDQLVCGVKSDVIRQRLFAEDSFTYSDAVKLSCSLEAAERNSAAVEQAQAGAGGALGFGAAGDSETLASAVNALTSSSGRPKWRKQAPVTNRDYDKNNIIIRCKCCGSEHDSERCRYKNFVCGKCKQRGHLKRVCPKRTHAGVENRRRVNNMEEEEEISEEDELVEDLHQLCLNGI